jgi:hypothetical protein
LEGKYLYASASGPWVRDSLFIYQFLSFTATSTSSEGNSRRSRGKHTELENIHAGPSSNLFGTVTLAARASHCTDAQPKYKHIATHSASRHFSLQPQHSSGSPIQPRNQRATIRTPTWNLPRKSLGYLRAINHVAAKRGLDAADTASKTSKKARTAETPDTTDTVVQKDSRFLNLPAGILYLLLHPHNC